MAENSPDSGKGKNVVEEPHDETGESDDEECVNQILFYEPEYFALNLGIVKECVLSMPYMTQLTSDKWNLFLRLPQIENILFGFLKEEEEEDVKEAIPVNVYDKDGHEFQMMFKKFHRGPINYYVLNRGWFTFCNQQRLGENDIIALRTFRHAITDKLSFVVTYIRLG